MDVSKEKEAREQEKKKKGGYDMRLVDADDLLTAFPIGDEPMVTIACIRATIKHMPTIEERKTGEWIDAVSSDHYKCSLCGFYAPYSSPYCEWLSDYCPNCGADMRGGNR